MFEIIKSLYDKEEERKRNLDGKITTAMLFIGLYISGIGFTFEKCNYCSSLVVLKICSILVSLSLLFFIFSIYYAIRTFFGYTYAYLTPESISERIDKLYEYYNKNYDKYFKKSSKTKEQLIENDVKEGIAKNYLECTRHNCKRNNDKTKFYRLFANLIITALMLIAINLLIYFLPLTGLFQ